MICPRCGGEWKTKLVGGIFGLGGKKRQLCSRCGYLDDRDCWINDEYVGPKDRDPRLDDAKEQQKIKDAIEFFDKHVMPCCGSKKFKEGPHGGMNVNIECSECGTWFNIVPDPELRWIERL